MQKSVILIWKGITYQDSKGNLKTTTPRVGYEVTERAIDKRGQILLAPDIELNTWWTNLGLVDDEIIQLYIYMRSSRLLIHDC